MKTFFKLLAVSVLAQSFLCPAAFAEKRNGGGSSGGYRSSASRPQVSGSSQRFGSVQRSMPRMQQPGRYSYRPSPGYMPRQFARPPQFQTMRPPVRQSVAPRAQNIPGRQSAALPAQRVPSQLPQVSGRYANSRPAASKNPVVSPPRQTVTGKSAASPKSAILPNRQGVASRDARPSSGGKVAAIPAGRSNPMPSGMTRNQGGQPRIAAANQGRVIGTHPTVAPPQQNRIIGRHPDTAAHNGRPWWNAGGSTMNNNFRMNPTWNVRRQNWGYAPWWNRTCYRPWYGGCWNWGWNRPYYYNNYCYNRWYGGYVLPGYVVYDSYYPVGWGLLGWSLGSWIYDSGYRTYYNPYPVSTPVVAEGVNVNYTEPIARIAADTAPADETGVEKITRTSEFYVADSQSAFKQRNYLVALELADKAIAASPGDGALHEYRALVLFALGKYSDAAGVLNPVIASGPGWDRSTMIALYDSPETYDSQLKKLEAWTTAKPDAADSHFLLGYHYMVGGQLDLAGPQFELASKLMPSDGVSKELVELTKATARDSDKSAPAEAEPPPPPVPLEKLAGVWVSNRDSGSTITLTFGDDGKFTWAYNKDGKINQLAGDYSMNDNGALVLDSGESQMTANVALPAEGELKFVLTGGPPADPGLDFKKR